MSPAPGSYVGDLIEAAGGRNVLPRGSKVWVEVPAESVLQLDPDLIIEIPSADQATAMMAAAVYPAAMGRSKVVTVPDGEVFYHPGPGVGRALWALARAIHPSLFPEATAPAKVAR